MPPKNLSNIKRKILENDKNQTRDCWVWGKYATSELCSPLWSDLYFTQLNLKYLGRSVRRTFGWVLGLSTKSLGVRLMWRHLGFLYIFYFRFGYESWYCKQAEGAIVVLLGWSCARTTPRLYNYAWIVKLGLGLRVWHTFLFVLLQFWWKVV